MRVLLGVPHNPLTSMGGAEVHAKNLATKLRDRGHAVRVVCVDKPQVFSGSGTRRTQSSDGFAFEVLQLPEQRRNEGLGWIYDDAFARRAILDVAAEFQPDVFHMISGYLLSGSGPKALSEKGVPVVLTLADYYFLCPRLHRIRSNGELCIQSDYGADCARCLAEERRRFRLPARYAPRPTDRAWQWAARFPIARTWLRRRILECRRRHDYLIGVLQGAEAIISPSLHVLRLAAQAGISEQKLHCIAHGIDSAFRAVRSLDREPGVPLRLGCFGYVTDLKGIHVAVEAVRRFAGNGLVELLVYGSTDHSPSYARRLRQSAASCPSIRFAGAVPHERVPEMMSTLDAVVVPTLCIETFSFAVHEAFAVGVPVVVSRTPYTETLVRDGVTGLLFRRGDAEDLHAKIRTLKDNPELQDALRKGAPPVSTIEEEIDRVVGVYNAAVGADIQPTR